MTNLLINMSNLKKKCVIIGISSGIAAYKIIDLITALRRKNLDVEIIMTDAATRMIAPVLFERATGHAVHTTLFPSDFNYEEVLQKRQVEHIRIADKASVFVVAPATANSIGKIASGIADDFLTTTILASTSPKIICPSMNMHMWQSPFVQGNIEKLRKNGFYFIHPEEGALACGYTGIGRLADIAKIEEKIYQILLNKKRLQQYKIIVTAGGTTESIDAVRMITNRSSGKMGVALADTCFEQGANVLLLRAKHSVVPCYPITEKLFDSSIELLDLIKKNAPNYHIIFHCAAVSDFFLKKTFLRKISSDKPIILRLYPTTKILYEIKKWNRNMKVVGFKAVYKETEKDIVEIGKDKLQQSGADTIIVNDIGKDGIGFGSDENEVYIISHDRQILKIKRSPKIEIARKIIEFLLY